MVDVEDVAPETLRPLRRVEYERMAELGMFEDERVELLAGRLVVMSPPGSPHSETVARLTHLLVVALDGRARVNVQLPLAASEISEPRPDLAMVAPGDYSRAHPSSAFWVIEVSESSLRKDRLVKDALYAEAGIPEYWIVDIPGRAVEVHRDPAGGAYETVTRHVEDETLRPLRFPDLAIEVRAILPSA